MTTGTQTSSLSSAEVCSLTGMTYRQLDWWLRRGVLGDPDAWTQGSGSVRRFTESEARVLGVLRRLSGTTGEGTRAVDTALLASAAQLLAREGVPDGGYLAVNNTRAHLVDAIGLVDLLAEGSGWAVVALTEP